MMNWLASKSVGLITNLSRFIPTRFFFFFRSFGFIKTTNGVGFAVWTNEWTALHESDSDIYPVSFASRCIAPRASFRVSCVAHKVSFTSHSTQRQLLPPGLQHRLEPSVEHSGHWKIEKSSGSNGRPHLGHFSVSLGWGFINWRPVFLATGPEPVACMFPMGCCFTSPYRTANSQVTFLAGISKPTLRCPSRKQHCASGPSS